MATTPATQLVRARQAYAALERFAARRARFLDALDLDALAPDAVHEVENRSAQLTGDLAEAWLLVDYLEGQIAVDAVLFPMPAEPATG